MSDADNQSTKTHNNFVKIVATPTDDAWSQAYNAGELFAVFSLSKSASDETEALRNIGKTIINNLEAEFFTLEEKNLASIKQALLIACKDIPANIAPSIALAYIKDPLLYVFIYHAGQILIKRGNEIGKILVKEESDDPIITASGNLSNYDIIILQTQTFSQHISHDALKSALSASSLTDVAEELSPLIHGQEIGAASTIIIQYHKEKIEAEDSEQEESLETTAIPTNIPQDTFEESKPKKRFDRVHFSLPAIKLPNISLQHMMHINHKKKVFLSLACIIVVILIASIFLTTKKKTDTKNQAFFTQVYTTAQKDYDDGEGLLSLNKSLARENLLNALQTLQQNKDKFQTGSKEEQQITALLTKTQDALKQVSGATESQAKETDIAASPLLSIEKDHGSASYFAQDDNAVYILTDKDVTKVDKKTKSAKTIITNNNDWSSIAGIGVFTDNIYILDKKKGVLKFSPSGDSFSKSNYFPSDSTPDLSLASAMSIDGSIWILATDGTVRKFTKGKSDDLKVTGLDKLMNQPTRIVTNADMDNVYILDSGNQRVVVLNKTGGYQTQYQTNILSKAKDIDVFEKDKKFIVLSDNKAWEITLK